MVVFVIFLAISIFILSGSLVKAKDNNNLDWMTASLKFTDRGSVDKLPTLDYWGVSCTNIGDYDFMYYGSDKPTKMTQKASQGSCAKVTEYGKLFSGSGDQLMLNNTDVAIGFFDNKASRTRDFIEPIPGSHDILTFNGSTTGLFIYPDLLSNMIPVYQTKNIVFSELKYYQLIKPMYATENQIKYDDGSSFVDFPARLSLDFNESGSSLSFSTSRFPVLVDIRTKTVFQYGKRLNLYDSSLPYIHTSVAPDTNHSFVTEWSSGFSNNIYDLSNCKNSSGKVRNCPGRDITTELRQHIPGYEYTYQADFVRNNQLDLYVKTTDSKKLYSITLADAEASSYQYLALGDSFASGEGARDYKTNTDIKDNRCHISKVSYPYLIKNNLSLPQTESVACSGAVIRDVITTDLDEYNKDRGPQAKNKTEPLYNTEINNNFLPGYRAQLNFIDKYQPDIVTLSIGGNDIGFGDIIKSCVAPGSCYESDSSKRELLDRVMGQFDNLVDTYKSITKTSPHTKLYVVGYPSIVDPSDDADCALNVRLSKTDRQLAQKIVDDLDAMIERASKRAGVGYIDVKDALVGHRLCETDSWNVAVNGLTVGDDKWGILGNESYHPNQLGHILLAGEIERQTNKFANTIASPDNSIDNILPSSSLVSSGYDEFLKDRTISEQSEQIAPYAVTPGQNLDSVVQTNKYFNYPGANYSLEIHSNPTITGSAVATDMDKLTVEAKIPEDIELGYHTLHLKGLDMAGTKIDIYQPVVVYKSLDDFDGDGIENNQDQCNFISPTNIDSDKDGIDDGCDSFIDKPPAVSNPTIPTTISVPPTLTPENFDTTKQPPKTKTNSNTIQQSINNLSLQNTNTISNNNHSRPDIRSVIKPKISNRTHNKIPTSVLGDSVTSPAKTHKNTPITSRNILPIFITVVIIGFIGTGFYIWRRRFKN